MCVHMTEKWHEWLRSNTRGVSRSEIAASAGIDPSGVSRWLNGTVKPKAENVVVFARKIGRPPVEALVAAGYLTKDEASAVIEVGEPLSERTDEELLEEIALRLSQRARGPKGDDVTHRLATPDDGGESVENDL